VDTLILQTPEQLTAHLKALRGQRHVTQAQIAKRLGIKQARYAAIEAHPELVSAGQLLDVLAILGVDVLLRPRAPTDRDAASRSREDW